MDDAAEIALAAGEQARREERLEDAAQAFARAVALLRDRGDDSRLGRALARQAQIARDRGDLSGAAQLQQEAVSRLGDGDPADLAHALRHLGDILGEAGRDEEAGTHYRRLCALRRDQPAPPLEHANTLRSLALHAEATGQIADAIRLWSEAKAAYADAGEQLRAMTGSDDNAGIAEAERRLSRLGPDRGA